MNVHIDPSISTIIPTFKIGVIQYNDIVIGDSPKMLKGRLQFFQETILVDLETKRLDDFPGINEWRAVFKQLNSNPKRYPPSHEALYTRIKKKRFLPSVHSAVDLNNFFSLQYEIPLGIYDLSKLKGDVTIRLGTENDTYEGLNGRVNTMTNKLISCDEDGPFGSPIVDSVRTKVTENTKHALHLVYLRPSMKVEEAKQLLQAIEKMFLQIHGGEAEHAVIVP